MAGGEIYALFELEPDPDWAATRQADGPQDFVAAKEIDHLHAACVAGIARFERGQERLDGDVKGKIIELLTGWRLEAHFVGRARACDKQVARADLPRDPHPANVAFTEFRHAPEVAGNVGLWGGGHEKTIHHARKSPAPGIKPRPMECNAIGHHFAGEIPGKGGGGACGRACSDLAFAGKDYTKLRRVSQEAPNWVSARK